MVNQHILLSKCVSKGRAKVLMHMPSEKCPARMLKGTHSSSKFQLSFEPCIPHFEGQRQRLSQDPIIVLRQLTQLATRISSECQLRGTLSTLVKMLPLQRTCHARKLKPTHSCCSHFHLNHSALTWRGTDKAQVKIQ